MTDLELLRWIHEQLEAGMPIGPYDSMTNYATQVKEWKCTGCGGTGESRWPEWRLVFAHETGCKWMEFMKRVDAFDAAPGSE